MHDEKILVVEDEGIVAEDISRSLQRLGYAVPAIAASGEEAIRKAEEFGPDLVLMDIVLQGEIDGIEAAKKICTDFNIPVVYLTAYADEEMLERAKITEPIGYILKPYNEKELHATIEMAIYQYKTGRRRRETELSQILESTPDCVVIANSSGQIMRINVQTEKIFGYGRSELIGKPIEILIPERYHGAHIQHRRGYYSSPHMRPMGACLDLYGLRKDGSEFPVDVLLSPIETGKGLSVIAIIRDITDRKEAEMVLKESEQKFRALIEKSYDGVMLVDINGLIRYASPGVTRILGYTSSELVCSNAFDIMYPNDLQYTQNLFSHLIQTPAEVVTSQFRYRHKDGSWRWLEGTGTNLLADPAVQTIVGNFSDITEQKRAERRLTTQYAVTLVLAKSATLNEAAQKIIQAICETTGWDMGAIWFIDKQANVLRCVDCWHQPSVDFSEFESVTRQFAFAPGDGMPGRVWASGKPAWIIDVTKDTNFPRAPYAAKSDLHGAFGFPIMLGTRVLGIIEFFSQEIRQVDEELLDMFDALGSQIGQFIERKQAEEALQNSEERFRQIAENINEVFWMTDLEKNTMLYISPGYETIWGRTRETLYASPMSWLDAIHPEDRDRVLGSATKRQVRGEYDEKYRIVRPDGSIRWIRDRAFPVRDEKGEIYRIVGIAEDITAHKEAEEMIYRLAYYDVLTELPNRLLLRDNIDRAISAARLDNRPFALFIMNLSRFKEINNTLGHQNGDIILQEVARRLQDALGDAYTIARMGGDDFAVLMTNIDANSAPKMVSKITSSLENPFSLEGISLNISSSTGISVFPGHGEDADTLIRRAYIAMDEAKTTESGFCIYMPKSDQYIPERLALMGELRSAIGLNQLFLLYQPKVDLGTGRTIGVEALVRWQHPKSGIMPPDQFISLAEKCGLIRQLTFWVLREALRQLRGWHLAGLDLSIAVNLSVRSLQAPLLLDQIKGLLATWGVDPSWLRFEITESVIMSDPELAMEIITQLTLMGIRFSIDDFGTGYSSLKYLQRLPVDEIKIDKSFIMNMLTDENSMKIVRSTIELAHSLGLKVIAEGVENLETFEKLISIGCDAAQGYFISRPIAHTELTAWLRTQGQKPGGDKS